MKTWQRYGAGLTALAGLVAQGRAQSFPGVPSVAPPPPPVAAAPVAAVPAAPAAPPNTLWSFLGISKAQKAACRERLCQTQLGLLLNNTMAPLRLFTGGIVPPLCPGLPTAAELADKGAVGAAAAIKKDEAEAKARIAAVKYLGTVSCHYWAEAQDALVASLRKDRNECVRWQAAIALGSGCCCTKKTIKALAVTISGSDEDGGFAETSDRVKAAAEVALYHCLDCFTETVPAPATEKKPEVPPERAVPRTPEAPGTEPRPTAGQGVTPTGAASAPAGDPDVRWAAFARRVESQPAAEVIAEARRVLSHAQPTPPAAMPPAGSRGLVNIIVNAAETAPPHALAMAAPAAPAAKKAAPAEAPLLTERPKDPEPPTNVYDLLMGRRNDRPKSRTELASLLGEPKPAPLDVSPFKRESLTKTDAAPRPPSPPPVKMAVDTFTPPVLPPAPVPVVPPTPPVTVGKPESAPILPSPTTRPTVAPATLSLAWQTPPPSPRSTPVLPPAPAKSAPAKAPSGSSYAVLGSSLPQSGKAEVMPSAHELVQTLRESHNPFQKEAAADKLAVVGWPANGEVIPALLKAARTDPAATVRVHCIRALTVRHVQTPEVLSALKDLKKDADPRVQHEAEAALARLSSHPTASHPTLQPASASFPGRSN